MPARSLHLKGVLSMDASRELVMNLNIRPVCDDDIDEVVRISLLAWTPVFESFEQILGPDIYPILYPDWRKSQQQAIEAACRHEDMTAVWVAEFDGRVVGFIAYQLDRKTETGEVTLLAVLPEYQNRGIGTELNKFALGKIQEGGMKMARVGTGGDASHAPARRSYEKAGYTPLPLVRYYRNL
jgi:GNAT superfamily N-acetyltransferase